MTDEDDFDDNEEYPWEDVEAARTNNRLQRKHSADEAKQRYATIAKACSQCHASASELTWFYFSSPPETWESLCGCAGWMTVCDHCHQQVDFFEEVMN
jgi:hypothetical protein